MLIEHGADVTAQNKDGAHSITPLASGYGKVEVARMLIERGADVTARNKLRGDSITRGFVAWTGSSWHAYRARWESPQK
jgi:ankyrin repeat protein